MVASPTFRAVALVTGRRRALLHRTLHSSQYLGVSLQSALAVLVVRHEDRSASQVARGRLATAAVLGRLVAALSRDGGRSRSEVGRGACTAVDSCARATVRAWRRVIWWARVGLTSPARNWAQRTPRGVGTIAAVRKDGATSSEAGLLHAPIAARHARNAAHTDRATWAVVKWVESPRQASCRFAKAHKCVLMTTGWPLEGTCRVALH